MADTDEATPFLIHPGVRVYVNGEQRSFFDRYSDYIYLVAFIGSGMGSVAAGLFGWFGVRREGDPSEPLRKMQTLLDGVREAPNADELDRCEREADEMVRSVYAHAIKDELQPSSITGFDMAMHELRARIAARRAALAG